MIGLAVGHSEKPMRSLDVLAKVASDELETEPQTYRTSSRTPKEGQKSAQENSKHVKKEDGQTVSKKSSLQEKSPKKGTGGNVETAETTIKEEEAQSKKLPKKVTKRSIQSLEEVTLEHIIHLSTRSIFSLFADLTSDEIKRLYTYHCFLMPDKCQEQFSSFGNETRARIQMMKHLDGHIHTLTERANDPNAKEEFIAIPLRVRRKKETEAAKKKKRPALATTEPTSSKKRKTKAKFTSLKSSKSSDKESGNDSSEEEKTPMNEPQSSASGSQDSEKSKSKKTKSSSEIGQGQKKGNKRQIQKQSSVDKSAEESQITLGDNAKEAEKKSASLAEGNVPATASGTKQQRKKSSKSPPIKSQEDTAQTMPESPSENVQHVAAEKLAQVQPFLDHSYTSVCGKKPGWHSVYEGNDDSEDDGDISDSSSSTSAQSQGSGLSVPILPLSHVSGGEVPMVSVEEIVPRKMNTVAAVTVAGPSSEDTGHSGEKPYPPMPKSLLATRGRLAVPEEDHSASEVEECVASPKRRKKVATFSRAQRESPADWEKRVALRCIRELKGRKKDDKMTLVCKICKDKSFTAGATLMYHYRSHAGIKPFQCLICKTTFTRQHSLNYHMLIHNNLSRFNCKDCGRKFRHPSHFKEHLRRHTGETPFECKECKSKFKTRNTYKRHLKTRHGKLLTAFGIIP
ncbi:zinc finger protein 37-like isoform X2 [Pomacea canaliculata]|nr:zinc finger protein 37-like isoform X2 [Pomacea canaliculata]